VFVLVKQVNRLHRLIDAGEAPIPLTPPPPREVVLLEEIRDLLKAQATPPPPR
jgi:large-conductance mechanosensitive channel